MTYHTPPVFEKIGPRRTILSFKRGGAKAYTDAIKRRIYEAMHGRSARRRDHRGHVPGQQAGKSSRRLPGRDSSTLASANRTPSPSPPAWPKPACGRSSTFTPRSCSARSTRFSRKCAAKPARHIHPGPRRPDRSGRADASRRLRHPLHAAVPELGRSWRRATNEMSRRCLSSRRPPVRADGDPLPQGQPGGVERSATPIGAGPSRSLRVGRGRLLPRIRHAVPGTASSGASDSRKG